MNEFSKKSTKFKTELNSGFYIENFLDEKKYKALEIDFQKILDKGLFHEPSEACFVKSKASAGADSEPYSAYICMPGTILPESFHVFASNEFHNWVSGLTGVELTKDMTFSLHYHLPNSQKGWIHTDYELVNFRKSNSNVDLNILQNGFPSQGQPIYGNGFYSVVRSIALIFYLDDGSWQPGDGGATEICNGSGVTLSAFNPVRNSMGLFVIDPKSFHRFEGQNKKARKAIVMWFHSKPELQFKKYRKIPARASFDDIRTFNETFDVAQLKSCWAQIESILNAHQIGVSAISDGKKMSELILSWQIQYEIAINAVILYLLRLNLDTQLEAEFKKIFPEKNWRHTENYLRIDFNSLWQATQSNDISNEIKIYNSLEQIKLPRLEIMSFAVLAFADFIFHKNRTPKHLSIRHRLFQAAKYIGPKLSKRILEDIDAERKIIKQEIRQFGTILLTGASSGLGKKLLEQFLAQGKKCIALARDPNSLNVKYERFKKQLSVIKCDLESLEQVSEIFSKHDFSEVDLFVHSAAQAEDSTYHGLSFKPSLWLEEFSVNTFSPAILIGDFLKTNPKNIVFCLISSHSGIINSADPATNLIVYKSSKAALNMLTSNLAKINTDNIFINVFPGQFQSKMSPAASDVSGSVAVKLINLLKACEPMHSGNCYDINGNQIC